MTQRLSDAFHCVVRSEVFSDCCFPEIQEFTFFCGSFLALQLNSF